MNTVRILVVLTSMLVSVGVYGQDNNYPPNGSVGLGTGTATSKLDVVATAVSGSEKVLRIGVSDAPNDYLLFSNSTAEQYMFVPGIWGRYASDIRPAIFMGGEISSANDNGSYPVVVFDAKSSGSFVSNRNVFLWRNHTNNLMVLGPTGNLGIGVASPSHKLEVNGTIKTREVNVTTTGWADYVFKPEYKLMPLSELETFIQKYEHLPNVATEAEVMENGVNLKEMNVKLLEKVEELTLYLLEFHKKNEEQDQLIQELLKNHNNEK